MQTCLRAGIACLLATLFCLLGQGSAAAHTELSESSPAQGDALAAAPTQVVLRFSEAVVPELSDVVLQSPDNRTHEPDRLAIATDGALVASLDSHGPDGVWTMRYRVVSVDGHPVVGTLQFSVGAGAVEQADAPAAPVRWVVAGLALLLVGAVALALRHAAGKEPDPAAVELTPARRS